PSLRSKGGTENLRVTVGRHGLTKNKRCHPEPKAKDLALRFLPLPVTKQKTHTKYNQSRAHPRHSSPDRCAHCRSGLLPPRPRRTHTGNLRRNSPRNEHA